MIESTGDLPEEWVFDVQIVATVNRAIRLQKDFDIDTPSTALVIKLLGELELLRTENKMLKQRLNRFLEG